MGIQYPIQHNMSVTRQVGDLYQSIHTEYEPEIVSLARSMFTQLYLQKHFS